MNLASILFIYVLHVHIHIVTKWNEHVCAQCWQDDGVGGIPTLEVGTLFYA
jgi:hypothetical protein